MAKVLPRIAYVTDLHLGSLTANSARVASFNAKIAPLRNLGIKTVINGGDLFDLRPDMWQPNGVVDTALSMERRAELIAHSAELVRDLFGKMSSKTGKNGLFFSVLGNADFLSAEALYGFKAAHSLKLFHNFQFPLPNPYNGLVGWTMREEGMPPIFIAGLSGVPALSHDTGAVNVNINNPWYRGVLASEEYRMLVEKVILPGRENILVSHMPALGVMDSFFHTGINKFFADRGSPDLKTQIEKLAPILHLTGHVHNAPLAKGDYKPFVVSTNRRTVTINPGGGGLHDEEIRGISGVKIAVIDPFKLIEMRDAGSLTEENITEKKAVEII